MQSIDECRTKVSIGDAIEIAGINDGRRAGVYVKHDSAEDLSKFVKTSALTCPA